MRQLLVGKHRNSDFILLLSGDRCQAGDDKGAEEMVFSFDEFTPEMILVEGELNELEERRSMKQCGLEGLYDTGFMYQDDTKIRQAQGEKMQLPKEKKEKENNTARLTVTLHGPPKIGKTTFISKMDDVLIIATEAGHKHIEAFVHPVTTWLEFLQTAKLLATEEHQFKGVAIDTVDNLVQLCRTHVLNENKIKDESDFGYGKGYKLVQQEFSRALDKLTLMMGVWFISHTVEKEIENYLGKKHTKKIPSLPNKQMKYITGLSDCILFADLEQEDGGKYSRVIRCQNSNDWEAGDRSGLLPRTLPLDYNAFKSCFEGVSATKLQQARDLVGSDDITPAIAFAHIEELRTAAQQMFDEGAVIDSFSRFEAIEINTDAEAVDALLHAQELFDTMEKGLQNEGQ